MQPFIAGALSSGSTFAHPTTQPASAALEPSTTHGQPGYWRIGQTDARAWWFISPKNEREFLNTVTTVQPFQQARNAAGPHFVSQDWNGSIGKFDGDLHSWAEKTWQRVQASGFKGLGAWCHPIFHDLPVPMTRDLNIWAYYKAGTEKIFTPTWIDNCDQIVSSQVTKLRDNKNLVGYYTDNELDWSDASIGPAVYFNHLPANDNNRIEVISAIKALWPTIEEFNSAWETKLPSYQDVESMQTLPREPAGAYDRLLGVWLEKVARQYFTITTAAIRKYDPNHLILGVRFKGYAPSEVVRASRGLTDAQSINYYVADALLDPDMFRRMHEESGQPVIITEYAFHALDGQSENRNTFGFPAQVRDQNARAEGYKQFTTRLARVPYIIGADWFQWNDEPPSGRNVDAEDVNFGIVDVNDQPYAKLMNTVRETTPLLNPLHAVSGSDSQIGIFRDSFVPPPEMVVHKLDKAPTLDGQLTEWSENNRMPGLRSGGTLGNDRGDSRLPNTYTGWRDEGLYVAMEIFDPIIETMPANQNWWTRDYIELFISTQPVKPNQQTYDTASHQFFYVPQPDGQDKLGLVGQWHRPGDALTENQIPHKEIQQVTTQHPDRYIVEMFIPKTALSGWDVANNREFAMNVHIRDFNRANDFFWSAPKELVTEKRPCTWGKVILSDR